MQVETVENALVVAFGNGPSRGISRPAGVFAADGTLVERATCWRDSKLRTTSRPAMPDKSEIAETLQGTWLFGGMLYAHFGHFLVESLGRLWGLGAPDVTVDGVLFYPKKQVTWDRKLLEPVMPWLKIAGVDVPVRLAKAPMTVERLVVPDQGWGMSDMIAGEPEFRSYIAANFGRNVSASGARKIYISRSQLFSKRGRILAEEKLEQLLQMQGYTIFHPQAHPIDAQIAQYKAAEIVISGDCSALHLAAFFARPSTKVAIVVRRPGPTIDSYLGQYRAFAGLEPLVIDSILQMYAFEGAKTSFLGEVYTTIDFQALRQTLAEHGFIDPAADWVIPEAEEIAAELLHLSESVGAPIQLLAGG